MATDTDARMQATLSLADYTGQVRVEAVRGFEEVSRGFEYIIDFQAKDLELDALRASAALLTLEGPHGSRNIHGMIAGIEVLALEDARVLDLYSYRITLRPRMSLLALRRGFRIFQKLSVVEIAEKIFRDAKIPDGAYDARTGAYPERDYCVQHDESEWAFIGRLFEEEGIYFYFDHAPDGHVLVIADQSSNADPMEPGYLPFDFVGGLQGRLCARELAVSARAHVNSVTLRDCHPLRPSTPLSAHELITSAFGREHYEYPSGCVDPAHQKLLARIRADEARGAANATRVRSNALGATAGKRVTIDGHPTSDDGDFFVRAVRTEIVFRATANRAGDADTRSAVCNIDLELQPLAMPFRPERLTPRPRIAGVQTARVTGPAGQEVSFDEHGRVTVQFHWDREGKLDENSSKPIPVAQGHTTGSMAMPRIGWEVLIDFVDGNPDRPVCLGRLYNAFFPPPVSLPAEKTVSTMRSDTIGGAGYNLLRFDDRAGAELFELHAQHDLNVVIANDKTVQVEHKAQRGVGMNRSVTIGANETESFESTLSASVAHDQDLDIGANRTTKITGNSTEQTAGNYTLSVGAAESIQVGSPSAALISLLTSTAIQGAVGAAATAAKRMGASALGPLMPALAAARESLGGAAKLAGPAAGLLSGGDPHGTALAGSIGALADLHASIDVDTATSMAAAAASAELGPKISAAVRAGAGASGAADGGGAAAATGTGNLTMSVTGNVSENIGALVAISSAQSIAQGYGGNRTETIGAARIEAIKGGRSESTGAAKTENVGVYTVKAQSGITIDAGAAASIDIAGALEQTIGGSHTLSGKTNTRLKVQSLKLHGKTSIALICGMAKIVIDGSGIVFSGIQKIDIEGNEIELDPVDIGPG